MDIPFATEYITMRRAATNSPQIALEAPSSSVDPFPARRIGALWRRVVAFLIDGCFVCLIGFFLGYAFFDLLMGLGAVGRLVGYFVGYCYFAIPESSFGNGQSLGKRLLRLQIVDRHGNRLSIERSSIRYTIFAIPLFLYGLPLHITAAPWVSDATRGLIIFGLASTNLYLMLFDRNTRQGVHDLGAAGYVAEAGMDGPVAVRPIWPPHWVLTAGILILAGVAWVLAPGLTRSGTPREFLSDVRHIEQIPGVQSASIRHIAAKSGSGDDRTFIVEVRCTISTVDEGALANQVADSLLTIDPSVQQFNTLRIVLVRGYDIGIAHASFSQTYSDSPAHWRQQFFSVPPQFPAH